MSADMDRRGRQLYSLLADELRAVLAKPRDKRLALLSAKRRAENSVALVLESEPGGERRPNHHVVEIGDHVLALGRLPAPPRRNGRQQKIVAAQPAAEAWQESQESPRLKDARAKRIDDGDRALPHRLCQTRRPDT